MPRIPADIAPVFERFVEGPTVIRDAIAGIGAGTISRPGPEGWSIRDVVVHLADTELVRGVRLRRVIAEDKPAIDAMDEQLWKRRLQYLWRSVEASLAMFELARFTSAELLRECDAQSWQRTGLHATDGDLSVADLVARGVRHVDDHAEQIHRLRGQGGHDQGQ